MPPKDDIELGYRSLHIEGKGLEEPYIVLPKDVRLVKGWTLAECKECGYKFPVTNYYALLLGTKGWTCPRCTFNKALEDARKRREL